MGGTNTKIAYQQTAFSQVNSFGQKVVEYRDLHAGGGKIVKYKDKDFKTCLMILPFKQFHYAKFKWIKHVNKTKQKHK